MGDYFPPMTTPPREFNDPGNVIFSDDGTVWANYLLRGVNTDPYSTSRIGDAQAANERLFSALSRLPFTEGLLLGAKAKTPADTIIARSSAGIPNLSPQNYPELLDQYNALYNLVESGERAEYQRIYVLSLGFPTRRSWLESMLSSVAVIDPHRNVNLREIEELERTYFRGLPREFQPARIHPDHVDWVFDRVRQRGITVPNFPAPSSADRAAVPNPHRFADILINKNADTDALYEKFVADVADDNPAIVERARRRPPLLTLFITAIAAIAAAVTGSLINDIRPAAIAAALACASAIAAGVGFSRSATAVDARSALAANFRSARYSRSISVHNMQTRCAEFPDGYTSYQTHVAIARYPAADSFEINTFTYLVDQETGLDGDFALRFDFSQDVISKKGIRKFRKELTAEANANIIDELDAEDYAEIGDESRQLRAAVKSAPAARGMRVAAIFSFAHQNREVLEERVDAIMEHFVEHDFTPILPVAAQYDLWQAMMPGSACPQSVEDLKQVTTTKLFGAFLPVRRTVLGDPIGVPVAVNKENALGQIVHIDVLGAADKGNASMLFCASPGGGKSEVIKTLTGFMHDLHRPVHLIDQDPDGEYEVFAHAITAPQVIHVAEPHLSTGGGVSLDPLKCFAPADAARIFMDLWMPLLEIRMRSEAAELLSALLDPEYRKTSGIRSTRNLMQTLEGLAGAEARELLAGFNFWSRQPYTHAFIDPIIDGQVVNDGRGYPPFNATSLVVVFRTHKLSVSRGSEDAKISQQFAAMAYTAIAYLTAQRFNEVPGPCMFAADELKFLKDSPVLSILVEQPDRQARKAGNFVVVAAQLAEDFDSSTSMIHRRAIGRQEKRANAAAAAVLADLPPTEGIVNRIMEASPLDPDTRIPLPDRAGEGWYNDGVTAGELKWLGHLLPHRRRYSDTTPSRRIRARDLHARTADRSGRGGAAA